MPRRALALPLVLFIALVFLSGCFSTEPSLLVVSYTYELQIRTDAPIENVTFLVPIPTCGDRPAVGPEPITVDFYSERLSQNITPAIVRVEGRQYLQLTAPFMHAERSIHVHYRNYTPMKKFSPEVVPQLINTLYPFDNESLFFPKQNFTPKEETQNPDSGYDYYTIPVYAHYENGTRVEIYSDLRGLNEWVEGFDNNCGNYYSDFYYLSITGDPQGWMPASGMMRVGSGTYREWQVEPTPDASAGS
ncbi:MAG: hypothetical protein PHP59_07595 [Methanofollis sp.]|uniref:hypothetical protein n=1 Tax=Methanofollis sp. TaxID=2052835 RepID=UPI00260A51BB|nr:hypothetical protein [Methanofollis sp.]MDD4255224.1 hypothetical protein [Methanofollis sp.]